MALNVVQAGVPEVLQAVQALHAHANPETTRQADEWLKAWQQSQSAWQVADQILQMDDAGLEITFIAAQTLRTKIQFDFCELPSNAWAPLRDSLLKHLIKFRSMQHQPVATQLSIAVADLAIQMDKEWPRVIQFLIDHLAGSPENLAVFLDVLKSLPEENLNRKLMTDHEKRASTKQALVESIGDVMQLLHQIHATQCTSALATKKVLDCFLAWLKFGTFMPSDLANMKLVLAAFGYLEDPTLSEIGTDVVVEILRMIPAEQTQEYMPLIQVILPPILETKVKVAQYLQAGDEDSVLPYARIFTEMGEALTVMMVDEVKQPQVAQLFQIQLSLTRFPSMELSQMPFEFWLRLFDHFKKVNGVGWKGYLPDEFRPLVLELLNALIDRVQCPANRDPFIADDDFAQYRGRVQAVFDEAVLALGPDAALQHVLQSLQTRHAEGVCLQEAHFFLLTGLVARAEVRDDSVLWHLIISLPQLIRQESAGNHMVEYTKKTAVDLVGHLPKWLSARDSSIRAALDMLSVLLVAPAPQGLPPTDPTVERLRHLQLSAANAYRELAICCRRELMPMGSNLLQLYQQAGTTLPGKQMLLVVEGTGAVLVELDGQQFEEAMSALIGPLITMLQSEQQVKVLADTLDYVQAVIRQVRCHEGSPKEISMGNFITQLWPMLQQLISRFPAESSIAEKTCRVVKHSMRCCPTPFKPLVPSLGQTLIQAFSACQHSSYLYSAEILGSTYGADPAMQTALQELNVQLSKIALGILNGNVNKLDDFTEVVEDYYGMQDRYLKHCPHIMLQSEQLAPTLALLPMVLKVIQRDAIEAVIAFTCSFMGCARKYPQVHARAVEVSPAIVDTVFRVMLSVPPPYVTDQLSQILEAVRDCCREQYNAWIIASIPILPPQVVSEAERDRCASRFIDGAGYRLSGFIWDLAYRAEQLALRSRNHKLAR
jgi:transportin-3